MEGSRSTVTRSVAVGCAPGLLRRTYPKGYKALWFAASVLQHIFVPSSYADQPTKNELETYGWGSVLARTTRGDRGHRAGLGLLECGAWRFRLQRSGPHTLVSD